MKLSWMFAEIIARAPYLVAFITFSLCAISTVVVFRYKGLPDFTDPIKGFEPRGTEVNGKLRVYKELEQMVDDGKLTNSYGSYDGEEANDDVEVDVELNRRSLSEPGIHKRQTNPFEFNRNHYARCANRYLSPNQAKIIIQSNWQFQPNMLTLTHIHDVCAYTERYLAPYFALTNCSGYSVGTLMSGLYDKPCSQLNASDLGDFLSLMRECFPLFEADFASSVVDTCLRQGHPSRCCNYSVVWKVSQFLLDKDFAFDPSAPLEATLVAVVSFRYRRDVDLMDLYYEIGGSIPTRYRSIHLVGFDADDLKFQVFEELLWSDMYYFGFAGFAVFLCMFCFTRSVIIVLAAASDVILCFGLAYFLYSYVFQLQFFPFLGVLCLILLIAISVDDVFVFFHAFQLAKAEVSNPDDLVAVIHQSLVHAASSIFVTSATTSAAFFGCVSSSITSIRLFGIFCGIAVLIDYVTMITWILPVIVIVDKLDKRLSACCRRGFSLFDWIRNVSSRVEALIFHSLLPFLIAKLWWLWILCFFGCGAAFGITALYHPGLELPTSQEFQLLPRSNVLERYSLELRQRFRFDDLRGGSILQVSDKLWFSAVWGVEPVDHGNFLDPDVASVPAFRDDFELAEPETLRWIDRFCLTGRAFDWINILASFSRCWTAEYRRHMETDCGESPPSGAEGPDPCCSHSEDSFPYTRALNLLCFPRVSIKMDAHHSGGLVFNSKVFFEGDRLRAIAITWPTSFSLTYSYSEMANYTRFFSDTFRGLTDGAPPPVRSGWSFVPQSYFYDLQKAIIDGTFMAVLISLSVATLVMLLTSLNFVLTLFALVTITGSIFTTVGSLVLQGWQLNILESTTLSLAVGLSIDFTIHFGVAYRLSGSGVRAGRVNDGFRRVGSSVLMASLTTLLAGATVLPSEVLIYRQIGMFLILVMVASWLFANLLFQSLCYSIGPGMARCGVSRLKVDSGAAHDAGAGAPLGAGDAQGDGAPQAIDMRPQTETIDSIPDTLWKSRPLTNGSCRTNGFTTPPILFGLRNGSVSAPSSVPTIATEPGYPINKRPSRPRPSENARIYNTLSSTAL